MDNTFLKHYFSKTAGVYKGNVANFAGREEPAPDYVDMLSTMLVGPNYLPRPRDGESVYATIRRRNRAWDSAREGSELVKNYPQLAFMGNPHMVAAHLHEVLHNPSVSFQ